MRVISLLWGYSLGGIGKVALTYGRLHEVSSVKVKTIIIQNKNVEVDLTPLDQIDSTVIFIKNRLDFSWLKKLYKEIVIFKPNALFVHGFNGPVIASLLKLFYFKNLPLVCSYHGLYHATTKSKKIIEPLFNYIPILVYRYIADQVVTVESYSKKVLESKGVSSDKLSVVYNGLNKFSTTRSVNLSKWNLNKDDFIIGCASRLDPVKGLSYLIDAFHALYKTHGNKFKLVIIGEGTVKEELQKKVNDLNLTNSIIFTGYQNNINDWLNIIDVFALPSLSEYHSIGLLEAMRARKAIVATRVGGNPESIRHLKEGILIDSKSTDQLVLALNQLYSDSNLAQTLAENAFQRFNSNFSEEASMNSLTKIFTKY